MRYHRVSKALMVFGGLAFPVSSTLGFEGSFKLPCMISYDDKVPFVVNCTVMIKINKALVIEVVRTPNGKAFIIENDRLDVGKWYLNHVAAVIVSDEPKPCYRNAEVKICL